MNNVNEVIITPPEGYTIDEENSSFTCIKFKEVEKKKVKCWENLETIEGFYINSDSNIREAEGYTASDNVKNVFATKEQAEACIALAMLSQVMKNVNGDWIPNWKECNQKKKKFVIRFYEDTIVSDSSEVCSFFLSFPTEKIRDNFIKDYKELIIKAKPLL